MARNWAITIGINGYRYLQRLQYAKRDADSVRQFFSQELGFEQVYHFTEDSPPIPQDYGPDLDSAPTCTTLRRFFRTRFEQPFLREGDNLWCFFAGHGIRDRNRDYLMPIDGDRGDLAGSAISINYISERLRCSGADNIILLIDACRSYEGRRDGVGIGQEKQQGVITLFSCSPEESSYEIPELQQGAFTHVLIESLRLQGEGNCATVERLYQRLRYYVPQVTRQYKRVAQTPYGVIEPPSKNHLILLPQQATLTDVVALKNDALTAEVGRDAKTAKQLWIRVLMVSPGDPEAISGIERLSRGSVAPPPANRPASNTPVTPRAAVPTPPAITTRPKQVNAGASPRRVPPAKQSPMPVKSSGSSSTSAKKVTSPSRPPQRLVSSSPRRTSPYTLGDRISRRRAIQILGFTGGGFGTILLGRALLQTDDWKLPELEPPTKNGAISEFNVATVNVQSKSIEIERKQAEFRTEELGNGVTLDLMVIPGGTFMMGSPEGQGSNDERPQHKVTIQSFMMGKYAVTQAQWKAVAALPKVERDLEAAPSRFEGDSRPVEEISWDDTVEFCKRLSEQTGREYRLPSEAEWEYACRAETTTPFHVGDTLTLDLGNYRATSTYGSGPKGKYREKTTDVGSFPANAFGLYDMHGNVWEWCQDHWHENYEGAPTDGSAWISSDEDALRLLRGGSWNNYLGYCRSANRVRLTRGSRYNIGFRVVCASSWTL